MPRSKKSSRNAEAQTPTDAFMEKLKIFVRTRGADFLNDPNITSVGIGYKQTDGKPTKQVSIQFTVGKKVAPEALEALDTQLIPESFTIDGVVVPSDVLQRSYQPGYKIVAERVVSSRKTRVDPILPGISIAHTRVTAGTLGCIVYDQHSATPYILSNWHVLHGPLGQIGDDIVQPGPFDDNRIQLNRLGKLVRSHIGAAGDCAIASIEDRTFTPNILDLDVPVEQLGEAELGDKVIKSGRTTSVTHGIVTRVHTIVRIDYGGRTGEQQIGGFEIGPDPNHAAANGQISMGGDSGSAWMFKATNGTTTRIMAGLHFAGESAGEPNDYAVACYARAIFEKLEISPKPPAAPIDDTGILPRRGYDQDFLGQRLAVPTLTAEGTRQAYKRGRLTTIPYTHFSLALHKIRRFAIWVAWNIDGGQLRKLSRRGIPFKLDPNIPAQYQADDALYAGNRLDRGHIARRADLCWGSAAEAEQANRDSFFFTNITPQMDTFNQSAQGGIWGRLEDAVFENVDVENLRVSVIGGPIFRSDDREYRGVKIPREFYKVLAYVESGKLTAKAFLLTQNLEQLEILDLDEFRTYQVTLAEVERRCSLRFPNALRAADSFAEFVQNQPEIVAEWRPLDSLEQIRW